MCWLTSPLLLELQLVWRSNNNAELLIARQQSMTLCALVADAADFQTLMTPLVFNTSSIVGMTICTDITISEDLFVESDETFTVGLMPVDSSDIIDTVTGTNPVTVTIQDNDGMIIYFGKKSWLLTLLQMYNVYTVRSGF